MDEKFLFGVCLGMLGGALLIANSTKARQMVKDGQQQVENKVKEISKNEKNSK